MGIGKVKTFVMPLDFCLREVRTVAYTQICLHFHERIHTHTHTQSKSTWFFIMFNDKLFFKLVLRYLEKKIKYYL